MKANRIKHGRNRVPLAIAVLVILAVIGVGLKLGYDSLRRVCLEPCVIRDMSEQVSISEGKMVRSGTIADVLGLKVGTNLAEIDFARKREEVLAKIPNLRSIRITRKLPDRLVIVTEERTPIAKMGLRGQKRVTGRVVDAEGVVFMCQRGTQMLPTINETQAPGTHPGQRIAGRTLAALRLVEACREAEFLELGILDVDTSRHDFLVATLGNYSKVKILWDDMDDPNARSRKDLLTRLTHLRDTIRSKVTPETVIWNATVPGKIFADTQGKL